MGLEHAFDAILLVDAPETTRRDRIVRDRALTPETAQAMIDAQWPSASKRARAHFLIDNDGTPEQLQAKVEALWPALTGPDWPPPLPQPASEADTSP